MLEKVGFFHFGSGHQDPIGSLRAALRSAGHDVRGSLIVLPEGFNIRKTYWERGRCDFNPDVVVRLMDTSLEFGASFVAGLIISENEASSPEPPYSGAYLIDSAFCYLLTHKTEPDSKVKENYTPCPKSVDNVIVHQGVCVASMVCIDASQNVSPATRERQRELRAKLSNCGAEQAVLCVPAHPTFLEPEAMAKDHQWKGLTFVLASSYHLKSSVIARDGEILKSRQGEENIVEACALQ